MRRDRRLPILAATGVCVVVWAAAQSADVESAPAETSPSSTATTSTTTTTLETGDDTSSSTSSTSTTDPSSESSTSSSTSEPSALITVTLEALTNGCYGLAGDGGTLNGCSPDDPVVSAELPPGDYVLSPNSSLDSWVCDGGTLDGNTGRLTLSSADSDVKCAWEFEGSFLTTTTSTATSPVPTSPVDPTLPETGGGSLPQTGGGDGPRRDQIFIDEDLPASQYAAEIEARTFVATATVTIDGKDLDDVPGLVQGQPVPLTVVLEQVGGSDAILEVVRESLPDQEVVEFTRLNRVTITCDKPEGDTSAGCPDFDVKPAKQELEWPERTFDFEFTPLRAGEIEIVVSVEGLVIERPSGDIETALVAADSRFTVLVEVHPEQLLWGTFEASLREAAPLLVVDVPDAEPVRVAETVEVSSTFTYPYGVTPEDPIEIELQLERDEDGADAAIAPKELRREGDSIHQSWLVTPNEQGALGLVFSYDASATILGEPVHVTTQPIVKSLEVQPQPVASESIPTRVWNGSVTLAAGVGTLLATGMTAGGLYAKHRRKLAKLGATEAAAE